MTQGMVERVGIFDSALELVHLIWYLCYALLDEAHCAQTAESVLVGCQATTTYPPSLYITPSDINILLHHQ